MGGQPALASVPPYELRLKENVLGSPERRPCCSALGRVPLLPALPGTDLRAWQVHRAPGLPSCPTPILAEVPLCAWPLGPSALSSAVLCCCTCR